MLKTIPLTVLCFLAGMGMLAAQISFSVPNLQTCTNKISVPVAVTGFNNITAFSYSMEWNEAVLKFDSVGAFNLQDLEGSDFGTSQTNSGILTTAWIDNNASGETKANGTVIYRVYFTVLGATGSSSPVEFKDVPTPIIAAAGFPPVSLTVTTNNGSVNVGDSTPPTITCPAPVSVNVPGTTAVVNGLAPTAADNCATPTVTYATTGATTLSGANNASGQTFNQGVTNVTYTATDGQNNTSNCAFTVTVTQVPTAVFFNASSDTAFCNDNNISIAITTDNFDDITAFSFSLEWDEGIIDYASVNFAGFLQHLDAGDFGVSQTANGTITVAWVDDDGSGETLVDGDTLFILNFDVVGFPGDISGIDFSNTPTSIIAGQGFPPVSLTVVTADGNAAIVDNLPVITCPTNINRNAGATCTATATWTAPTATDDCGPATVAQTAGPVSGSSFPLGATTITYTATDNATQTQSCSFTVTVVDVTPPSIVCPGDQTLAANASCQFVLPNYATLATVLDNCTPIASIAITQVPAAGTLLTDTAEVMLIAMDLAGLKDTCVFDVNIGDDTPPVVTCPASDTLDNDLDECFALLDLAAAIATDNCGLDTFYHQFSGAIPNGGGNGGDVGSTQFPIGNTTVTFTAIDLGGDTTTCQTTIRVEDTQDPTITCPANDTLDIDLGECFAVLDLPAATFSENCQIDTIFYHFTGALASGGGDGEDVDSLEYPIGNTTVTFTIIDVNGNTATCATQVVVNDTIAPVITCPANISQSTDIGICTAVVTWATPVVTDNCSYVVTCTPPSGTVFPLGDSTVVCIVEDEGGNLDTCEFVVTVFDDEPLTMQCVADTTVLVPAGTVDTIIEDIYLFFLSDNCSLDTTYYQFTGAIPSGGGDGTDASGTAFPVGTTTVTYVGVDNAMNVGSCSFNVTIVEDVAFDVDCSNDQASANIPGSCFATFNGVTATAIPAQQLNSAYYEITGATTGSDLGLDASGDFNVGTSVVTFYAVSNGNDTVSCPVTIKVIDTQAPVFINCPTDTVTVGNTIDECGFLFNGSVLPVAADNCPGVVVDFNIALDSLLPLGTHTITAIATDAAGADATCTYPLEVIDNQSPKLLGCQHNSTITVNNDVDQCGAVVTWPTVTPDDNCQVFAFVLPSMGSGSFFPVGTTAVTYTVIDGVGNAATCVINVAVVDNQPPALTCPGNQTPVNTVLNECFAAVNFLTPTATDNCGTVTTVAVTPTGPNFNEGVSVVTYNATDAAGNLTSCSFTVTVEDNQFPFIPNMPADVTLSTDPGECGATATWTLPNFPLDNCGIESFGSAGGSPGDFFLVGTHFVQYIATDINGNTIIDTFAITVQDTTPPTLDCPASASITVDGGTIVDPDDVIGNYQQIDCDNIQLFLSELIPTDDCGIISFSQTTGLPSGSIFPLGDTDMTYVAVDNNGNPTSCTFTLTVLPAQIDPAEVTPAQVCEGGSVTFSVGDMPGAAYLWVNNNAPNVPVSTQSSFTLNNVSLSQAGTYTAYVALAFCDLEFTTTLTVNPTPVVTIDANDILCASSNEPLTLMGLNSSTAVVPNNNWVWTFPSGATVVGQNQTVNNPATGNYTVVATTAAGCSDSATEAVNFSSAPITPTLFGTTSNTCVGSDFVLNGQPFFGNNVTYHWSASPATGSGLTPINNFIVNPTPTVADTFTYYFYVTVDGCTSDTAEWVVIVEAYPTIVLDVTGETACVEGNSNITLTDNGTGATTWAWKKEPNIGLPGNTSSVTLQNVNSSFSGTYTVVATSPNLQCSSTASTQLTITEAPSPAATLTADDLTICEGGGVTLTGTQYNFANYVWTGDGLPPNIQNQNEVTAYPTGTGIFEYTFAALVGTCSTDTVSVSVVVEAMPAVAITVAGDQNCVDGTSPITLSTSATGISNFIWTDPSGNVISNASSATIDNVTAANAGMYFVDVVSSLGCTGFGSVQLDITNGIDGLVASITNDGCEDGEQHFEASGITGATYQWLTPTGAIFSTEQNPTILNISMVGAGTYSVIATNGGGCTDEASVDVEVLGAIEANDGEVTGNVDIPQEFNMSDFVNFDFENYTVTILQQPQNGTVTVADSLNPDSIFVFTPNAGFWGDDNLVVQFCNANCPGLCDEAVITLNINYPEEECVVTTLISPNEDGVNDELVVSCAEYHPLNTLIVFNQWGDKVYEAAPYLNDWEGTYDEKDLPDGTYFFIFQRDPDTAAQKGFVMIYR